MQAEVTVNINYFGTLNVINAMMPILNAGARLVTFFLVLILFLALLSLHVEVLFVLLCHIVDGLVFTSYAIFRWH